MLSRRRSATQQTRRTAKPGGWCDPDICMAAFQHKEDIPKCNVESQSVFLASSGRLLVDLIIGTSGNNNNSHCGVGEDELIDNAETEIQKFDLE